MKHDEEFRLESLAWLRNIRGAKFVRRLRRLVDRHGPARAIELLTHPTMSDELIECHAAAIEHVADQYPPNGLATNGWYGLAQKRGVAS